MEAGCNVSKGRIARAVDLGLWIRHGRQYCRRDVSGQRRGHCGDLIVVCVCGTQRQAAQIGRHRQPRADVIAQVEGARVHRAPHGHHVGEQNASKCRSARQRRIGSRVIDLVARHQIRDRDGPGGDRGRDILAGGIERIVGDRAAVAAGDVADREAADRDRVGV